MRGIGDEEKTERSGITDPGHNRVLIRKADLGDGISFPF